MQEQKASQKQPLTQGRPHQNRNVDLNSASLQELADLVIVAGLVVLGHQRAQAIINARPICSWLHLERVPGFDESIVDELQKAGATIGLPVA